MQGLGVHLVAAKLAVLRVELVQRKVSSSTSSATLPADAFRPWFETPAAAASRTPASSSFRYRTAGRQDHGSSHARDRFAFNVDLDKYCSVRTSSRDSSSRAVSTPYFPKRALFLSEASTGKGVHRGAQVREPAPLCFGFPFLGVVVAVEDDALEPGTWAASRLRSAAFSSAPSLIAALRWPASSSTDSATIVLSTVAGNEMLMAEPKARNSNLLPVKAKGDVRLRSPECRGNRGRTSVPRPSSPSCADALGRARLLQLFVNVL